TTPLSARTCRAFTPKERGRGLPRPLDGSREEARSGDRIPSWTGAQRDRCGTGVTTLVVVRGGPAVFAVRDAVAVVCSVRAGHDGRTDARGLRAQEGAGQAAVAVAVVLEVRLRRGDRGADVGLGGGLLRGSREAQVRRDGDRNQDAEDDHDDEELDQGEALLARQTGLDLVDHATVLLLIRKDIGLAGIDNGDRFSAHSDG